MDSRYCIGVDLGTTNTLCAVWTRGEAAPHLLPITQPFGDFTSAQFGRDELLPSAITVVGDRVFVGRAAKQSARMGKGQSITSIKRHMSSHWKRRIGDIDWSPDRVSACILKAVRREVVGPLGRFDVEPEKVVITVPASFGTDARRATLRAARLAGFDPATTVLFDEPTAALLHHLLGEGKMESVPPEGRMMMMIDIGGGTLDVSLMQLEQQGELLIADVLGRSRFNELAGDDFDLSLAGLILALYEDKEGSVKGTSDAAVKRLFAEILSEAEKAKERLSMLGAGVRREDRKLVVTPVKLENTPDGKIWRYELNLEHLVMALRKFFPLADDRTARGSEYSFFRPIQQCLDTAQQILGRAIDTEEVKETFLTGGSSSLPMVRMAVRRLMSSVPRHVAAPMNAVAFGAAWYAGMLLDYIGRTFELRERLYDGLFLETSGGRFRQLLGPQQQVPREGVIRCPLGTVLTLEQAERRIDVALYLGSGDKDPNLVPLARRRVDFGKVLPQRHPIGLTVVISRDRQLKFEFTAEFNGQTLPGQLTVSTSLGWERETDLENDSGRSFLLPQVNEPIRVS